MLVLYSFGIFSNLKLYVEFNGFELIKVRLIACLITEIFYFARLQTPGVGMKIKVK